MDLSENRDIAKLEARLRALEAIIQCVPGVFTNDVFEQAERHIRNPYRHPDDVAGLSINEETELAEDALNEIWRQMEEVPAG